jgi:methyl-accepting chemotaxis protein
MSNNDMVLLDKSLDAHIDAVKENTRQLQTLSLDMSKQTSLSERQAVAMEQIAAGLGGLNDRINEVEKGILEKLSSLVTSFKVQWVTISLGILPILYFVVKKWNGE